MERRRPRKRKAVKVVVAKLGRQRCIGLAIEEDGKQTIVVDPRQPEKERLNTLIHEAIHLADFDIPEAKVIRLANKAADVVWRQGYRRPTPTAE
jgi:rhodanese-related sulfurtransferase